MEPNKIHNLKSLLEEKQRLTAIVKSEEIELKNQMAFLESNYKSIIWEKINPFKDNQIGNLLLDVLPAVIGIGAQTPTTMLLGKGIRLALEKGSAFLLKRSEKRKEKKAKEKKNKD